MEPTPKDIERFWSKVNKTETCWLWTSSTRNGYGTFFLNGNVVSAHRLSYQLAYGDIGDRQVRHSCDTPECVNYQHLVLGNAKQNSDDKTLRDRHKFLLKNEQVLDMRSREVTSTMCRDLAEEFNIPVHAVKRVLTGESYGWLPGAIKLPPQFTGTVLTTEEVKEIKAALQKGKWGINRKLAKKYGVKEAVISHIKHGRLKYSYTDME